MTYLPGYCYFKLEDSYAKAENIGNGSSEKHLPFNPMLKFTPPKIFYPTESKQAFSSRSKTVVYNTKYRSEETQNEAWFRGIFLMMAGVWTNNTVTATWSGTEDTITGALNLTTHENTLSVNCHIKDSAASAHIDKTYVGTIVNTYGWRIDEVGGPMIEFWSWLAADIRDDAQAPDMDTGIDDGAFDADGDGGFDNWDGELNSKVINATNLTLTKNNSALTGVQIETFTMTLNFEVTLYYAFGTLYPIAYVKIPKDFVFEADVLVTGETYITQMYTLYASKSVDTFKLAYDANKYIQCTNTYIEELDFEGIPEAGKAMKGHLVIKGGEGFAPSFSWTGTEADDPSAHIDHADP